MLPIDPRCRNEQSIGPASWTKRLFKLNNIKIVKRVMVSVVGATVLLMGIALLVLPGPAFVVIPVGLAILATPVCVGATLAQKSSSNGEQCCFWSR